MKSLPFIFVGAVPFLVVTALSLWLQGTFALRSSKAYTHMHCAECGLEMAYQEFLRGKDCPQCGRAGPKLVSTIGPKADRHEVAARGGVLGNLLVSALLGLVVAVVCVYAFILYSRAREA